MVEKKQEKFISIKDKLVSLNTKLIAGIVFVLLLSTAVLFYLSIEKAFEKIQLRIEQNQLRKGMTLIRNNAIATKGMAEDNAFTAVSELVTSTVMQDSEIIYGEFISVDGDVWVDFVEKHEGSIDTYALELKKIELRKWSVKQTKAEYHLFDVAGLQLVEFASPVKNEFGRLGTIRFGFDSKSTLSEIDNERNKFLYRIYTGFIALLMVGLGVLFVGMRKSMAQALSITSPLEELTNAAKIIAGGNYQTKIEISSSDEIGLLAENFESMRKVIKEYTDELENKVRERTAMLEAAQKEALDNAHQAGMAEMATGTLHNVGNVLNSVVTSATMVSQGVSSMSLTKLNDANDLLKQHLANLEDFILNNPKGPMLLEYFIQLGDSLIEEREFVIQHLVRMQEKLDVIANAIAAQQSYASASIGHRAEIELGKVIDDVLAINAGGIAKHKIQVSKQLEYEGVLMLDKNKVMQVLVNLITNAIYAMKSNPPEMPRTLTIRLWHDTQDGCIILSVKDSGCGVKAEEQKKIFSYGYTTKKDGHGFGLHSSANFMTEMGGNLQMESKGENKGACFILSFPDSAQAILRQ
ncbi:ATP-binding protein [Aliikangiella sp. G2MR2-5]|uniref:sensor histidine kinase n=1 Tax=Aliikangiella sp. G2MR2-5 TaxID=2788943 RepID=UPI0018A9F2A5|nr:ATP-binding protein [Aliikangiella sp. G2MR2-5]